MNFFEAQDKAKRKTGQLTLLFGAAVFALVLLTNILVALALGFTGTQAGLSFSQTLASIPADSWLWISFGVIGIVTVASLYKYMSIQAGGRAIAEALGGTLIHQNIRDPKQRQLLNVVEEMAVASGVAVPPVYLINESSINAFAAGFGIDDAVIGINQGTLDCLTRAELQGVVAHEFSHILNGDTSINLRLMAILHGILFIGMLGYALGRAGGMSRRNGLALIAIGFGLLIVGYGGTFFGNMIKAAVSRQREYLADASAVQFTRDPSGIADALKKIGGAAAGSTMTHPAAAEISHMFFGAATVKLASSAMATHPPLEQRIRAIEPNWNGLFTESSTPPAGPGSSRQQQRSGTTGFAGLSGDTAVNTKVTPETIATHVGTLSDNSLGKAQQLIAGVSAGLTAAAHDPFEARALIYAMLIDSEPKLAQDQMTFIQHEAETGVAATVERLLPEVLQSDHCHLLTLLEMSIPALKELSRNQYRKFSQNTARLITADGHVAVFEWVLHRLLVKDLHPHFEGPQNLHGRIKTIRKVEDEAATLLSILASHSDTDASRQLAAYTAGASTLGIQRRFIQQHSFDYEQMNQSLGKLRQLKPLVKPTLIKGCAATILADGQVSATEGALIQGIAATLDCPLPPSIYADSTITRAG